MLKDNKKRRIVVVGGKGGGGIDQVQSDWNQTDNTQVDYIKNKPSVSNEWFGTQAEFDLIDPKDANTVYYIEDANGSVVHNNKTYGIKVHIENPELEDLNVTENGTYQSSTKYGYDEVTVNVQPNLETLNATENDTYTPTSPVQGFNRVVVNVPAPQLTTLNTTMNGDFTPSSPYVGYSSVRVEVSPTLQNKTVNQNGTVTADQGYDGLGTVTVNVSTPTEPFYVYDMSGTANTMTIKQVVDWGVVPAIEVFYSYDKSTWTSLGTTSTATPLTLALPVDGSKVYLRATCDRWGGLNHGECNNLNCSGEFGVGGNIMSLLYGANYEGATFTSDNAHAFQFLFSDLDYAKCKDAGDLILPSNTIDHCYNRMFMGCGLYRVPKLPATALTERCYAGMFQYANWATLMTPVLPATTLATACYEFMFYGCGAIKRIITYAQDISASNCLDAWLDQTSSTGDFYNLGGATYTSGASGIPSGWTEHSTL